MKFSVVIPCLNEEETIAQTISVLEKQNVGRSNFEIIVVIDEATKDKTAEKAKQAGADNVLFSSGGTNFARQKGVDNSTGEFIAFLDADSRPPVDWLEKIGDRLSKGNISGLSGPYDYGFKGFNKFLDNFFSGWLLPRLDKILFFIFRRKAGVMIGGNMASTRKNIEKIGGLPPLKFWGDDAAFAMVLSRKIGPVLFDPEVTVQSSPRRFEKEGILKLEYTYAKHYFQIYFSRDFE